MWSWKATSKTNLPDTVSPDLVFTHNALDDAKYQQLQHFAMVGAFNVGKDPELDATIRDRLAARRQAEVDQQLGKVAAVVTGSRAE